MTQEYDFIIVGGGTAGLVVANRLTEDPNIQVLVIEAGEDRTEDPRVKNLALFGRLFGSELDWKFESEPQPLVNDRKLNFNQGMALGGSSAMNACMFLSPSRDVIDGWEKLGKSRLEVKKHLGISWSDDELLTGPIKTSYPCQLDDPLMSSWDKTFKGIRYQVTEDPFSGVGVGSFPSLSTVDPATKERSYSATAYYKSATHRENFHVLTGGLVEKVLFQKTESNLQAVGVQFQRNGVATTAKARREVILAAGALQSPKLLELSGIGHNNLLKEHGIEVLVDNPYVGENLQDHVVSRMGLVGFEKTEDSMHLEPIDAAMARVKRTGRDPEGWTTLQRLLDSNTPQAAYPSHPQAETYYNLARYALESKDEASAAYLTSVWQNSPTDGSASEKAILVGVMLSEPLSRGNVHISSSNPTDSPIIDPKYFSHPLDLEIYARHVQYLETIAASSPFRIEISKIPGACEPGFYFKDLEVAKEYIRRTMASMWHPCGTCAMLLKEKGGVVDGRLVVFGTENLRAVDASIMPLIPRANPQATVYAVAERAADLIKEDHGLGV